MATSIVKQIKMPKEVKFVEAKGVTASIASNNTWVGDMSINIADYTAQGYTYHGFMPQSTGDYIVLGYRMNGNRIRLTAYNTFSASQSVTFGGVAIFSKDA